MTAAETAFRERWNAERQMYASWGAYITEFLVNSFGQLENAHFLKMPICPRVKEEGSLVEKAFYRKKPYQDPYNDIEDKVGLRVVVLLLEDVRVVERILTEQTELWIATKARDYDDEIDARPLVFDYQSLHYVLRAARDIEYLDCQIVQGTPCEVQVRTILQHAYGELTHDTLYKPSVRSTAQMQRVAAKSMALIEATSDYFSQVSTQINSAMQIDRSISSALNREYSDRVGQGIATTAESPLNQILVDHYRTLLDINDEELTNWLQLHPFVADRIRERTDARPVFRLPAILLVYAAVDQRPRLAKTDSPLNDEDLETIYNDLGRAFN